MKRVCGKGQRSPCYQNGVHCPKRKFGCHATCEEYMNWWTFNVEVVYPRREINSRLQDYTVKQKIKSVNRGGGKL